VSRFPTLAEKYPIRRNAEGQKVCSYCSGPLRSQRFRWCSTKCREAGWMETMGGEMRRQVHMRDHGVCAVCGWDTERFQRIAWHVRSATDFDGERFGPHPAWHWLFEWLGIFGYECRSLWEHDHIIALIEGGENVLANCRTLCVPCHKEETRKLAARRARRRKLERQPELPFTAQISATI